MVNDNGYLVGGLEHEFYDFPYIGNVIIPTDELIFFRGVGQPPTSIGYVDLYLFFGGITFRKCDRQVGFIQYMDLYVFICIYLNRVLLWSARSSAIYVLLNHSGKIQHYEHVFQRAWKPLTSPAAQSSDRCFGFLSRKTIELDKVCLMGTGSRVF